MPDASLVGQELDQWPLPVESSKVREFARALFDEDPIYVDEDAARAAGFDGIPAPLTFAAASSHYRQDLPLFERLNMDLGRVLHGESSCVSTRPGKRGGDMTFFTFEIKYVNQDGDLVLRERQVVLETGAQR
jgi:acyl dehydratase